MKDHPLKIKRTIRKEKKKAPEAIEEHALTLSNKGNQIDIGISDPKPNIIEKTKTKLASIETTMEALPYWKSFLTIAAVVMSVFFIGFMLIATMQFYPNISDTFPLFFSQSTQSWQMYDKEIIPIFVISLGALLGLILKLNHDTQIFDRRLSTMINIAIIIFDILGIVAFVEIFSLILIY